MAYIQTRQPDRARETWARAFRVPADSAAGHLVAAQMMVRAEMADMAQTELTAALKKDPRLPQANLLLGQAALSRGRFDDAIALFEKELATNPGNAMAYYRLGDAYTRQLEWDKALGALQRSVWLNPYFCGPYIMMREGVPRRRAIARRRGHAAPRHRLRPEQQDGALHPGPGPPAARPHGGGEEGARDRAAAQGTTDR
jgi:tetratricopeptide (TPR) repeat protein